MEHKDGNLYSCLTGKAFEGPRKGSQLEPAPTLVSDWGDRLARIPQTVAYEMFDKYKPVELPNQPTEDSLTSRGVIDARLPADEMVLGVNRLGEEWAFWLKELEKEQLIKARIGDKQWLILWDGTTRTAAAYSPIAHPVEKKAVAAPRPVTLTLDPSNRRSPFVDKETGAHCDIAGRAIDG